jgi:transcriptional regulator with XRE-family HTH domain
MTDDPKPQNELFVAIGRRIQERRRALGLTQEKIARRAGISVSFLSMLERGERSPHLATLVDIAGALVLPPVALLGGHATPPTAAAQDLIAWISGRQLSDVDAARLLAIAKAAFGERGQ